MLGTGVDEACAVLDAAARSLRRQHRPGTARFSIACLDPDADTAALELMHATNYLGVIAVIRAASRVLRTGGRIITVSSGLGSRVGAPGLADYSATKSGIERYTMGVARDLGPRNITAMSDPGALSAFLHPFRPVGGGH